MVSFVETVSFVFDDPSLRIDYFKIINLRGVSTKLNLYFNSDLFHSRATVRSTHY